MTPNLALLLDYSVVSRSVQYDWWRGETLSQTVVTANAKFFWGQRFWVKGGLGVAILGLDDDVQVARTSELTGLALGHPWASSFCKATEDMSSTPSTSWGWPCTIPRATRGLKSTRTGSEPRLLARLPLVLSNDGERIAKVLARAGVASRRQVERMIEEGRVEVDGQVLTSPAFLVTSVRGIKVDGRPVQAAEPTRMWLYHKPRGLITSHWDPQGRPTVFDNVDVGTDHLISVGRLDVNTEGLLLLTNDGGLSRYLELPATGWRRVYRVRVFGRPNEDDLRELKRGITVDGVHYGDIDAKIERRGRGPDAPVHIDPLGNHWLRMTLREGKNREIRRVLSHLGMETSRLIRVSYGPFELRDLEPEGVLEINNLPAIEALAPYFNTRPRVQ